MACGENKPQAGFFVLKHIGMFAGMALLILVIDVFLYIAIAIFESQVSYSHGPDSENSEARIDIAAVADSFAQNDQGWTFTNQELLDEMDARNCWTILIGPDGKVLWSHNTPDEFPSSFTQNEIAVISHDRAYGSYSTFIWTKDPNLVMMGYPGNQYLSWGITLSNQAFMRIPLYFLLVFTIDLLLIFLLYVFSQRSILKNTGPMLDALDNLAQGKPAHVSFTGALRVVGNRINAVSNTLLRKETARKNWVAGVSHDVRTPLAVAMGHAERIENDPALPESTHESAGIILRQGVRIRDLIEDLNIATQLEYDMQPLKMDTIPVAKLLRSVVVDYLNQGIDEHAEIDLDISESASKLAIEGDERLLKRALRNAVDNSLKHNPEHCHITISLNVNERGLALCVADDGRGMNHEQLMALATMLERDYLGVGSLISSTETSVLFAATQSYIPTERKPGSPDLPPESTTKTYATSAPVISSQKNAFGNGEDVLPSKKRPPMPPVMDSDSSLGADAPYAGSTERASPIPGSSTPGSPVAGPSISSPSVAEAYTPSPSVAGSSISGSPVTGSPIPGSPIISSSIPGQASSIPHGGSIGKHGLGLPLIARIVLVHKGTLTIASAVGEGFSIIMTFPHIERLDEQDPRELD